jgi:diguanylate cyclase (GGDEF)-like protein
VVSPPGGLPLTVADAVSSGLLVTSADGTPIWHNRALDALAGPGSNALPLDRAAPDGPPVEVAWTDPDGEHRWLELRCRTLEAHLLYEITCVTDRHAEREQAREDAWRLRRIEQAANIGTWEWDLTSGVITWSETLRAALGMADGEPLDFPAYRALLHVDDAGAVEAAIAESLRTAQPFSFTHRMHLADRTMLRVFQCYGEVFTDDAGTPVRLLGTAHDITEIRRIREELAYLADHDALTGLANRAAVTELLTERLTGPDRAKGSLLLVDVDNFKDINDLRGHATGDEVMRHLARLLVAELPADAVLGRLGGDEFAVVLRDGDATFAQETGQRLCDVIARAPLTVAGEAVRVAVSVGAAPLDGEPDSAALLAHADVALHEAKSAGRNRTRLYAPEQYRQTVQRVNVLSRIRTALDTARLELDAQPIVTLADGTIASYELLVRLRDGIYPYIGPAVFLPMLERGDLVLELDHWVITEAVTALSQVTDLNLDVNVSSRSLDDPGFGDWVTGALSRAGIAPARLGLEITETAAISNLQAAARLADQLRAAGCRFSLDDFGAGFGSFGYLKHLPFTTVKIAGEFVRQADRGKVDRVLVDAVVRAASGLGMSTVAEYVDREPLVAALRELGVDRGQGYHLGRPAPLSELLATAVPDDPPTRAFRRRS